MLIKLRARRGQGMTEYIIIIALIAIAAIGIISLFGDNIRALFASANALAGDENAGVDGKEVKKDQVDQPPSKDSEPDPADPTSGN